MGWRKSVSFWITVILDFPSMLAEIKVTTRLYRSGDGEYLINGKKLSFKDIHRLLQDSGIGNGYSVMGPGRISPDCRSAPMNAEP